jgi:long-chain acyl-CoA synthetase
VYPAEIEQILYRHPAVRELAIYGVPHKQKGEAVKAAIVLKKGATATREDIIEFCRRNMAAYKVPAEISFVDELPKSSTGKILKRVLRDQEK